MSLRATSHRHVLISGASTGIGKVAALYLASRDYVVWAGVRKAQDGAELEKRGGKSLKSVPLDVVDAASIAAAAGQIAQAAGDDGLCGLVNNAGIGVAGPVEFVPLDDWRRQFEVNLFGQIALTQAMLPLLRQHVKTAGAGTARIIFTGSVAGLVGQPILGPYCASKHALEAMCDSLRMEIKNQGIHVCLLEPGAIQSEIWRKGQDLLSTIKPDHPAWQLYGDLIDAMGGAASQSGRTALPADRVARVIEQCLTRPNPPTRRVIGRDATLAVVLRHLLPERWFDAVVLWTLRSAKGAAKSPGLSKLQAEQKDEQS